MHFSFRFFLMILLVLAGPLSACSPKERYFAPWEPPVNTTPQTTVAFEQSGTIALSPREKRTLSVTTDPPGAYEVSFLLLGQSLDGSLDRAVAVTDEQGHASITLRAPNQPTTFILRARINNGAHADLPVSVSGDGFAPISIIPLYQGKRVITGYTAMVIARKACDEVAPTLPADADGALFATADAGQEIIVKDAPVGPILSVTLRAGHFAWGCTTTSGLIANEMKTVKVNVIDKPIDVDATDLDVTFGISPDQGPFGALVGSARSSMLDAFFPADPDATAALLLDTMATRLSVDDVLAFADARTAGGWDAVTRDHLAAQPKPLRDALAMWFDEGFVSEPLEVEGRLRALGVPNFATFEAVRMGSVPSDEAGLPGTHLVKFTSSPGDVMLFNGNLFWMPTNWLTGIAKGAALKGAPEGKTMTDALAEVAGCDALAQTLVAAGACDATCLAAVCREALDVRFRAAKDASAVESKVGTIAISAAANALVDDVAVPVSLDGTWLGSVSDGDVAAKVEKGAMTATPGSDLDAPL